MGKINFILFFLLFQLSFVSAQEKVKVILLGTYHFNNPGNDMIKQKDRNILSKESQQDLEEITNKIKASAYKPDQIFVESNFNKKNELNANYQSYLKDQYHKFTDTIKRERLKRYYIEGETFQLGYRLAKKLEHQELYPIDSMIEMRFDILLKEVNSNPALKEEFSKINASLSDNCLEKSNLSDIFICINKKSNLDKNIGFYISFANKVMTNKDYLGSNLVTDWYKRNLVMYANIQNQLKPHTKTILVLVGSGHAAILRQFFEVDKNFELVDLTKVFDAK
ncbi:MULTISPECIES: DUF5694 domain-containing protein [Sphingobacterium]|uniref:DUF5694 domain-containing protein n=1 Tax=Sphingobacterium kitahiroshimense TaxID=470446 RepID=A0ABV0BXE2_9SPHI|nr:MULTISPECIES: DUF5694 domain-containing protein [unclassified Sphingobacterium]MBB2950915.1 hypothetical protein [Sphingobacterium sp. JUb56]NJI72573.1 hypothetical protein [Sphingobacterium sp. B16(2022)]